MAPSNPQVLSLYRLSKSTVACGGGTLKRPFCSLVGSTDFPPADQTLQGTRSNPKTFNHKLLPLSPSVRSTSFITVSNLKDNTAFSFVLFTCRTLAPQSPCHSQTSTDCSIIHLNLYTSVQVLIEPYVSKQICTTLFAGFQFPSGMWSSWHEKQMATSSLHNPRCLGPLQNLF